MNNVTINDGMKQQDRPDGSLWRWCDGDGGVYMLCRVAPYTWNLLSLSEGRRLCNSVDVVEHLFRGRRLERVLSVTVEHKP